VFSIYVIFMVKGLSLAYLDADRQMLVSSMLWELFGGAFGWTWMILAASSFVLVVKALIFSWELAVLPHLPHRVSRL